MTTPSWWWQASSWAGGCVSTASSRTRSFVPRYGIAGVGASCSPFKVDPRQSAGQARGARPPAGMCTRQEEEEEEEDQEEGEGEGGGAEKRAGALCFAFVLPSPALVCCSHHCHPTIASRGAQGRQQPSKSCHSREYKSRTSFIAKVSS